MVDIGLKPKTIIGMILSIGFLFIPRILVYFGLNHPILTDLTSAWATFIIIFIIGLLVVWNWLKKPKLTVILLLAVLIVAFLLTFYWCGLTLPSLW